jgi:hypothetical protein
MALHSIANAQKREYSVSNHSSSTAATLSVGNRAVLVEVFQAAKVNQTAAAGSWTVSLNGNQVTGLSSVAVTTEVAGVQVTNAQPTALTNLAKGDVLSVVGSSLSASNFTFVVREF